MPHVVGQQRVYVRRTPADEWTLAPYLRVLPEGDPLVRRVAGQVSVVRLAQTYGPGSEQQPYVNWANQWVAITYTPYGGAETAIFYGHLSDQTLDEAGQEVVWGAVSIEGQLANVVFSDGYAQPISADDLCHEVTLRTFNESLDEEAPLGWRSFYQYMFQAGEEFRTRKAGGGTDDCAYVFGNQEPWTAYEAIRTLIQTHCPIGGGAHCSVGFIVAATPAAYAALDGIVERWNWLGTDALTMLNRMVGSAGDLAWTVDWTESGIYGYDLPRIRIFSKLYDERDTEWQASHSFAAGGALPIETLQGGVTVSVKDRVTEVVAVGNTIKVQFTTRFSTWPLPMYVRGWTDADEAAWAEMADPDDPRAAELEHVYRRLYMPFNQTDGEGSTWRIFARPDPEDYFSKVGDKVPAGISYTEKQYPRAFRRILPTNLTMQGYAYTSQGVGPLAADGSGVAGRAEAHPILGWWNPDALPDYTRPVRIEGIRPLKHECGVMLPAQIDGVPAAEWATMMGTGDAAWKDLVITLTVETDLRLAWTVSESYLLGDGSEEEDTQRRRLVVQVPDAEWWVALDGTVIGVDETGAPTLVYGVLRNDLPKLQALAESTMARYSHREWASDIALVSVNPTLAVGQFVGTYGTFTLESVILAVEHHLGLTQVGTMLWTGRGWGRRGRV